MWWISIGIGTYLAGAAALIHGLARQLRAVKDKPIPGTSARYSDLPRGRLGGLLAVVVIFWPFAIPCALLCIAAEAFGRWLLGD